MPDTEYKLLYELYEKEKRKRQELQTKIDNLKNAIWDLISDDLYDKFEIIKND